MMWRPRNRRQLVGPQKGESVRFTAVSTSVRHPIRRRRAPSLGAVWWSSTGDVRHEADQIPSLQSLQSAPSGGQAMTEKRRGLRAYTAVIAAAVTVLGLVLIPAATASAAPSPAAAPSPKAAEATYANAACNVAPKNVTAKAFARCFAMVRTGPRQADQGQPERPAGHRARPGADPERLQAPGDRPGSDRRHRRRVR